MTVNADFNRVAQLAKLTAGEPFDLLVIGGGATGVGIAVDAATRGYRVALCEQSDFGKGTSSRSTKLIHGGVRYLEQGNVSLVRGALRERGLLRQNAPHLVSPLETIVPLYRWWEPAYYRAGLAVYDLLSAGQSFGRSGGLSREDTLQALPTLNPKDLRGGVRYFDGAFDDTRLLLSLSQTAVGHGAVCVNYARVDALVREASRVVGAEVTDVESGGTHTIRAKVVVNAGGPFSDSVRRLADENADDWIQPSQGAHIVLAASFLPGTAAMIVPKTSDGRVVFAIPWHGHVLVGTTDTALSETPLEPAPRAAEIDFLLETIGGYLTNRPARVDILSTFAGLRPLVKRGGAEATSSLGRDHEVRVDDARMVNVLGGKWTTYRKMAEDAVDRCAELAVLPKAPCRTRELPIGRAAGDDAQPNRLRHYGVNQARVRNVIEADPSHAQQLDTALPYTVGEAVWAVRSEMARTIEDVLSRRLRSLLLNAGAAVRSAPRVAAIIAEELGRDEQWQNGEVERFNRLAAGYVVADGE